MLGPTAPDVGTGLGRVAPHQSDAPVVFGPQSLTQACPLRVGLMRPVPAFSVSVSVAPTGKFRGELLARTWTVAEKGGPPYVVVMNLSVSSMGEAEPKSPGPKVMVADVSGRTSSCVAFARHVPTNALNLLSSELAGTGAGGVAGWALATPANDVGKAIRISDTTPSMRARCLCER